MGIERVFSHGGDVLNDGFAHDAFDCMRLLEYGGNFDTALNWSEVITKQNRRLRRRRFVNLLARFNSGPS